MHRLATPEDIDTVFALYMHEKVVRFLGYDPMPIEDFRAVYQALLDTRCFYVYEREGRIAGFYRATRYPGRIHHVAGLGTLAVDPAFHGQGIALAMVSEAIDTLKTAGVKRIELFAESDNAPALRFYEKLGFEREGTLRKYYKRAGEENYVDEYVMALLFD
ncbi:GNAT family N-acetyltransferase [Variovorax paradoxus]|uniref:GNAT family N-acetyltransferase n=1 Tax=Variovorax paradoxus TaxID=34073 RepID=UPI002160E844|nr:GNAT family N-acetyltransferase [Variovorax paradoxus]UVH57423.1 GNAT family N-acetyltransferase [Variovorax paradoxus]